MVINWESAGGRGRRAQPLSGPGWLPSRTARSRPGAGSPRCGGPGPALLRAARGPRGAAALALPLPRSCPRTAPRAGRRARPRGRNELRAGKRQIRLRWGEPGRSPSAARGPGAMRGPEELHHLDPTGLARSTQSGPQRCSRRQPFYHQRAPPVPPRVPGHWVFNVSAS